MEYGQIFHVRRIGKYYCKNMKYRISIGYTIARSGLRAHNPRVSVYTRGEAIVYLTCTTFLMRTIPSVGYVASLCPRYQKVWVMRP